MGLDGFSLASMSIPKEVTSAQAAAEAEQLAQAKNGKAVEKIDKAINKKINNEDKEKEQKNKFFKDGFDEDNDNDDSENPEENINESNTDDKNTSTPVIKDPENIVIRFNNKTEKVELYNKKTKKAVDSIDIVNFVEMVDKLDCNSGILVNKHI